MIRIESKDEPSTEQTMPEKQENEIINKLKNNQIKQSNDTIFFVVVDVQKWFVSFLILLCAEKSH